MDVSLSVNAAATYLILFLFSIYSYLLRVMKIRESIHSVFLQHAILESGMDVGIVNAHEMIAYDDLEEDMKLLCENLVFNKTEDATDDMLERTNWERACLDAKKKGEFFSLSRS